MAQFDNSNQSFIFTHKGEAKNAVNSDGTEVRLQSNARQVGRRCDQLLEEFDKLRKTAHLRYLITRLFKIYALSRELVCLLSTHERREAYELPYVYMGLDGNIRMHPEYQPELLEGEHFRIKEIDTPRN